jgi:hypothetical protein
MSDYVYGPPSQMTFGTRDGLAPGDSDKTVKGSQLDVEFQNLVTAVNSKLNISNPAFTGIMTGGTIDGGTF